MAHRFLIKEIALQAGLGVATVDRVLNARANVREHTRKRVEQAINELEKQQLNLASMGRKLIVDVMIEAPTRFTDEVRSALESELALLHPVVVRPRFLLQETMKPNDVVAMLRSICQRGSHGVVLKARDVPEIAEAIGELERHGIPVVTFVTDIPLSRRIAYAGLDNRVAGATAAYLLGQWLGPRPANVLITVSDEQFRGEEEREISFRRALRTCHPQINVVDAGGGHGIDAITEARVESVLGGNVPIAAVYSMGGGNTAILRALERHQQTPVCFIAHDLDRDNVRLLHERKIQAVLNHDLRQDMRSACHHVMHFHKLLPASAVASSSSVVVVTPENIPAHIASRFRD
ncbi:LacI family DNA-binding transcriptional regulator [Pararobbsia silviterrae]|uniref:LacI family DNA-binding transcriptional regulator n=1 Tax=Pararobbsia silviterrae TaxID=1792498 RepID=A0A494YBW3_9BURK|nr:LacI family DNA-binding transcriptional regulator [Pararobbsia silviterrae]RKP57770.1 LacI family DNA-binding transcriptional regulator [Pararobbsia silviterrae]